MNCLNYQLYKKYHIEMTRTGDCDPAYAGLKYVADRFELNIEQRFWLAFLYATCYCAPTVYYIYNEFPDYENVDVNRLQRWWDKNKRNTIFQTDRLKVKSFNKFVPMFESYKNLIGKNQYEFFSKFVESGDPIKSYQDLYNECGKIYYIGRFALFIYLECMQFLTGIPILPDTIKLEEAESSRNGLCYVLGLENLLTTKGDYKILTKEDYKKLYNGLEMLFLELKQEYPNDNTTYWSIETSLCSFKKIIWHKRYLGYYIDRLMVEIKKMENCIKEGVDWAVLWDFRKEYFDHKWLGEFNSWNGIRNNLMGKINLCLTANNLPTGVNLSLPM